MSSYDFVIIGGGSAGCVLANRLSANGQYSVCLLEAGRDGKSALVDTPMGILGLMNTSRYNWQFQGGPEPFQNNRTHYCPRGKALGGSSAINAMLYIRGHKDDYENWTPSGNPEWTFDDLLPYFKRSMHQERGESERHGVGGPLNVCDAPYRHPVAERFVMATVEVGHTYNPDFNGSDQNGMGWYQLTMKNGERCSAAKAYLFPIEGRDNLTIISQAYVTRILFEGKRAVGAEYEHQGKIQAVEARREVLLCAGAVQSPQLLMLSGVGDPDELGKHGISVVHPLTGVGKNLQEHADAVLVQRRKKHDSVSLNPLQLMTQGGEFWKYWRNRKGLLSMPPVEAGGFMKSDPSLDRPDLQVQCIPALFDDHGRNFRLMMGWGYSVHINLLRPKSRGTLTLNSSDPKDKPKLQFNMMSHPDDVALMIKGLRMMREVFAAPAFEEFKGEEVFPGSQAQSDEELAEFIRERGGHVYHPACTCKMGEDEEAVVDYRLRVHGMENLRVVDISILPDLISGNTNAPAIAIGEKASDMILSDTQESEEAQEERVEQKQVVAKKVRQGELEL
ncbi:choline dehydrogenase [Parendozoicomonas sp. Alg238-R29]|uniref:GMC family oxidoreductase n=1 Tax=Parendozoicomonas sp. Alg238-R29 TaxID=2993446 RepID=UPI00248E52B4|nr:choline dehydrogenase [Parendozoicomonas sp. Alg238-R29]